MPGDSRAGSCQKQVAATCPSEGLKLTFPSEPCMTAHWQPEMRLQRQFMLCLQHSSERENMHDALLRKDRKKISEDIFRVITKFQYYVEHKRKLVVLGTLYSSHSQQLFPLLFLLS